ncbi:MAG: PLP-dependent aminotransferase family protein [Lachnospiraceae bacterium]|nr:PLP-dependent aminotransferase family protein [Lachnospiraceae bacterium]
MNYNFPQKSLEGIPSMIRAVAQLAKNRPGFISLAIGNPAPEAIPSDIILEAAKEVISGEPMSILQYGDITGYDKLKEFTIERLKSVKHISDEGREIVMTVGSGQALGLVPAILCNEGDEVYSDQFAFTNALNAIKNAGCKLRGIPSDEYGMIPSELEKAALNGNGRYVYLIPNFHNPTGRTMPLGRRKELYEVARKCNLLIYEDDPYGELRFRGKDVPSFASFDEDRRVIYAGSYSKILAAGLRVGYIYGDSAIMEIIQKVKNATNGQSSAMINQMIVYNSFMKLNVPEYLNKLCGIYKSKCEALENALKSTCAPDVDVVEPEGGMFIWVTLPDRLNVDEFYEKCAENGVGIVKSIGFAADLSIPGNSFRLNFTSLPVEDIVKAGKIIGKLTN